MFKHLDEDVVALVVVIVKTPFEVNGNDVEKKVDFE